MTTHTNDNGIGFGLIFFASSETHHGEDKYRLVIESARFADRHGFSSVWIPERHFTKDGWLYPNPAVLQAAIARETRQIRLRAGSVVMPLHHPVRVAEEWAMVDNLSGGRVEISFASGWHPNDFVFFPENYEKRNEVMYRGIETVRRLWRGEAIEVKGGTGEPISIKTFPTPIQPELPFWLTAAGNPKTFAGAGEVGANLLTHMYNQSVEELAEKIRIYREARAKSGYDPATGQVSVMLHTFIGASEEAVREQVQGPFCNYLRSASYLLNAIAYSRGQKVDLATLSEEDINDYLNFVFERLISTQRVLFGTPESCFDLVRQLKEVGVNEIACQMDFGLETDVVLESMQYLNRLKQRCDAELTSGQTFTTMASNETPASGALNGSTHPHSSADTAPIRSSRQGTRLDEVRERCREEVPVANFYHRLRAHGVELEGSFQGIERLWRRDGEALGHVRVSEALEQEVARYQVHPTLLDACLQVLIATLPEALVRREEALYLPTGLRSFRLHKRPGNRVWSHAILHSNAGQSSGEFEGDVYILDDDGQLLIEAQGIQLLRSEPAPQPLQHEALSDWLYELRWEPIAWEQVRHLPAERVGKWLIFMDAAGVGQRLVDQLVAQGATCFTVVPGYTYQEMGRARYRVNPERPADMQRLVKSVIEADATPFRGVVHLWSLDATPSEQTTAASLEEDQMLSVGSALNVIQALIGSQAIEPPRLWLVSRGAQPVEAQPASLAVAQSPLWGLGRSCAMEQPELWGALVDADPASSTEETAGQLFSLIAEKSDEDQVAFRQGQCYVARMVRSPRQTRQELQLSPHVSYLITGGLWGLGLEVARWMAKKGARHLILLSRTQLPARAEWNRVEPGSRLALQIAGVRDVEALGAHVYCAAVDVTEEKQLREFLRDYQRQGLPPIKGVIHAASVWQDRQGQSLVRPLANLDLGALRDVFRPKVVGSWLLHTLLQNASLDFFVSFSSGASLFGSAAQGNYAAAGAFLDALAHYQRAHGQPGLSIDWGAVSQIGFGATPEGLRVHEYWESHGIQRITPEDVLAALELLIPQNVAQIGVLKLDWQLLREFFPQIGSLPLVKYLVAEAQGESGGASVATQKESSVVQAVWQADEEQRQHIIESYLCEQVAGVLRVPPSRLDVEQPLTTLGLDSLMAIELKNRIEHELKVRIPIVTFLQGPSIAQFSVQVLEQLAAPTPTTTESVTASVAQSRQDDGRVALVDQGGAEQLLKQLDQLSDAEVDSLLNQMLQEKEPVSGAVYDVSPQEAEQLLAQLDQLSDKEVDSLLNQIAQQEEELNR